MGLLAFGALTFLQTQNASPTPSLPGAAAASSTAPADSSTSLQSLLPEVSLVATSSPQPTLTPTPTLYVPDVQEGPGYVTFGTAANDQLEIKDPQATFTNEGRMVWSAYLPDPVDSVDLRIEVLKLDSSAPEGQRLVRNDAVRPKAKNAQHFLRQVRIKRVLDGPGLYTVRYVRGTDVLAEGSFLVLEPGASPPAG